MERLQGLLCAVLFRRCRQRQTVDVHVPFRDTQCRGTIQDAFGDGEPVCRLFGNAVFVQGQSHDRSAVFLDQRQDVLQRCLFAVDGIDDGLTIIYPKCSLHDSRDGGVQLQRCAADGLERLYRADHHALFVDARHTYIHIQKVSPGIHLLHCLIQDVVHVVCLERRLEPLFAGGVDALADDAWLVDLHHFGCRADCCRDLDVFPFRDLCLFQQVISRLDMLRCRAAAAAVDGDAQLCKLHHSLCKFRRVYQIFSGDRVRESGVGLYHQRQRGPLCHLLHNGKEFVRTERAVHAHSVSPQAFQRHCRRGNGAAGKGAEVRLKGHGADHRLVGIFLCRQQCRLGLVQVGHGLNDDEVGILSGENLFLENIVCLFKGQRSQRFQQLSDRADVQRHLGLRSGAGFPGAGDAGGDQFLDRIAGFCHFVPVCPEGIGIDDVRTHGDELFLCINDAFRFCDVVDFRQCADRHTAFLQHGTHAAVQTNEFAVRK